MGKDSDDLGGDDDIIFDVLELNIQILEQYLIHFPLDILPGDVKKFGEIDTIFKLVDYDP